MRCKGLQCLEKYVRKESERCNVFSVGTRYIAMEGGKVGLRIAGWRAGLMKKRGTNRNQHKALVGLCFEEGTGG